MEPQSTTRGLRLPQPAIRQATKPIQNTSPPRCPEDKHVRVHVHTAALAANSRARQVMGTASRRVPISAAGWVIAHGQASTSERVAPPAPPTRARRPRPVPHDPLFGAPSRSSYRPRATQEHPRTHQATRARLMARQSPQALGDRRPPSGSRGQRRDPRQGASNKVLRAAHCEQQGSTAVGGVSERLDSRLAAHWLPARGAPLAPGRAPPVGRRQRLFVAIGAPVRGP